MFPTTGKCVELGFLYIGIVAAKKGKDKMWDVLENIFEL